MSDPKLGTVYVPVLYSLNQLKKMREKKEKGSLNTAINTVPITNSSRVESSVTHIVDNDSSDDDEISVIYDKNASKPTPKKNLNSSFETTLFKNFSVKENVTELQHISVNVPTTTKVNLFVPTESQNHLSSETSNSPITDRDEIYNDKESIFNSSINDTAKPIPLLNKQTKENPLDALKIKIASMFETKDNEKTVLVKKEMVGNLRNNLLYCIDELEGKIKILEEKEIQINGLKKNIDILTKENETHIKTADKKEIEIQNLQNKFVLLTQDYRKSEEMRRANEKDIENLKINENAFKSEKENLNGELNKLKTNLKVLPGKERRIGELENKIKVLNERNEEFEHLKIKVLPEKDTIILGLKTKVNLLGQTETVILEQKSVIQKLKESLREKQTSLDAVLEEKNKHVSEKEIALEQKISELAEKQNHIQDLQQRAKHLLDGKNELQTKLNEKDKDMSKKEEIIEYFEAKVNEISRKEKEFEEFKDKVCTENEEYKKDMELLTANLHSSKEKVCELEVNILELTKKNNQIQDLNDNYDLKINSLKSELLEVNMSNMYNDDIEETKKQLEILSTEREELLEQNSKLLADISAKEGKESSNEITITSLQSMISENESSLQTKKEMNTKLQDAVDELEKMNSEKEDKILNFNLKMDELSKSKELIELKNVKCEDKIKFLENKLNDKRKLISSTSEAHKVLSKKYNALKTEKANYQTEKANLIKEVRNVSALQIKVKSLEEQLLKAREENGDEPGLVIDDQVLEDEPSTSTSAKSSSPAKIPVSSKSLSSRDPRRKNAEAKQTSEIVDSPQTEYKSSKEINGPLVNMTDEPSKSLKEQPLTNAPNVDMSDVLPNSGHAEEVLQRSMNPEAIKPPLPFNSIFDISTPPPPPPPPFSQLNAASTIPLPTSFSNPAFSLTSHLNPGLSQLSTWMTKNTAKHVSEYRTLSTSSAPQNEISPTLSNNFYSTPNVVDWSQKRSRSKERDIEDRYGSRGREDNIYRQQGSISRERERSDGRRSDNRYYDRSYDNYYQREGRNRAEYSPKGKKWKTEYPNYYDNSDWNVVPNKYSNLKSRF